ncbi:ZTF-9 protein [Aphelenchoides avenae]|nr:ZTF-9 protein [Aphelenchus avenae]
MPSCGLCKSAHFARVEELEAHITGDHFNCTPYECEKCRFAKFPTEYAVREHYEKDHKMSDYHVRYHISPDTLKKRIQVRQALMASLGQGFKGVTDPQVLSMDIAESGYLSGDVSVGIMEGIFGLGPTATDGHNGGALTTESVSTISPGAAAVSEEDDDVMVLGETASGGITLDQEGMQDTINNLILKAQAQQHNSLKDLAQVSFELLRTASPSSSYHARTAPNPQKMKIHCRECHTAVANRSNSFLYHTNVRHLQLPLFRCTACNKVFPSVAKIDILKHVKNLHNGDESLIEDNQKKYMPRIRDACTKYFDYKPQYRVSHRGAFGLRRRASSNSVATDA